jgi:hypothetical protein
MSKVFTFLLVLATLLPAWALFICLLGKLLGNGVETYNNICSYGVKYRENYNFFSIKYAADGSNFVIVTGPNMVR